jgi:hypothetical protein
MCKLQTLLQEPHSVCDTGDDRPETGRLDQLLLETASRALNTGLLLEGAVDEQRVVTDRGDLFIS